MMGAVEKVSRKDAKAQSIRLSDCENHVLRRLKTIAFDDGNYMNFKSIGHHSRFNRAEIRRACRSLARRGYTEFGKGLMYEDGELAGAGYCITHKGLNALRAFESLRETKGGN